MNAARAGLIAASAAYNAQNTVPVQEYGWDTYAARLGRYWIYDSYRNNTAYSSFNSIALTLKAANNLYKHIRGVYNPVFRQNQLLVSYIYGGSIDMENLTSGAIPIVTGNAALIEAIKQVFTWSRWGENKSIYTRYGALLGDSVLKIIDDREKQKVRMEVLHPGKVRDVELDAVGNVLSILIEYERDPDTDVSSITPGRFSPLNNWQNNKSYTYSEKITKDTFETFKDGEPFAYYADASGKPVAAWANEYGFVPVVMCQHQPSGLKWGENAFHASIRKIDEVNDLASLLDDQIRKAVIPLLYAAGTRGESDLDADTSQKDKYTILYGPKDSTLQPVIADIDIVGAGGRIDAVLQELERDLPELALQRMRESAGTNMTAPGVKAAYSDAIGRINEARGQYDSALVRALQMAISIGGYNQYENFGGFNLNSYDAGALDFYIKDRPVINDELSLNERIISLGSVGSMTPALQRLALEEMGYDEEAIESVVLDGETQTRNAARGFAEGLNMFDMGDDEPPPDDESGTDNEEAIAAETA